MDGNTLSSAVKLLQTIQAIYFHRLQQAILPNLKTEAEAESVRFRDRYHALVLHSLSSCGILKHFSSFMHTQASSLFVNFASENRAGGDEEDQVNDLEAALKRTKSVLSALNEVGLGGAHVQSILAETVDDGLTTYVAGEFSNSGLDSTSNAEKLRAWVENRLSLLVINAVTSLKMDGDSTNIDWDQQISGETSNWKERAVHELAALRLNEAFRIVVEWRHNMPSGLHDLLPFTKSAPGRAFTIDKFTAAAASRLLQPGASTTEILQVYVHMIMAFLELDPKGVLLDRLSRPLRRYLRERQDTVKTIIQGLLLDVRDDDDFEEPLEELAKVLSELQERHAPDDDIDKELYDLSWEPDPVDAAPEYKSDERGEIIGSLIDIFENKEVFIKEFQNVLSERLLENEHEFQRELQVLELFKKRIGESNLQACEVMLKDITDSRRIDEFVKKDPKMPRAASLLQTKILSRFYWPSLQTDDFTIPKDIQDLQESFATGFEHFKPSRKLTWLNSLGSAKIELHLKDRVVEEEVHTWQASVIQAFAAPTSESKSVISRTADEIQEELQMDDDLVQAALTFWVGKMVIRKQGVHYSVLEELPADFESSTGTGGQGESSLAATAAAASASAAATDAGGVRRSDEKVAEEKMAMFWLFIQNMLRNQGAMPLFKIVMMLKIAVQGGFPYTNDELKAFLARRIEEGQLELAGGNYKIVVQNK